MTSNSCEFTPSRGAIFSLPGPGCFVYTLSPLLHQGTHNFFPISFLHNTLHAARRWGESNRRALSSADPRPIPMLSGGEREVGFSFLGPDLRRSDEAEAVALPHTHTQVRTTAAM